MGRFNNETLEVQNLRIDMMTSILIHGLKKGVFASALARDPPIDTEQLMAMAQKYIDEEEMNAMKDEEWRVTSERARDGRFGRDRDVRPKREKKKEPLYQSKYSKYTPLNMTRAKALMLVEKDTVLIWPKHTRITLAKRRQNPHNFVERRRDRRGRSRSRERRPNWVTERENQTVGENAPVKGIIHTIAGGSERWSRRARRRFERESRLERREQGVNMTGNPEIVFGDRDAGTRIVTDNDSMVIRMDIANFTVHKVLIDNGSSADIIFKEMLNKMGLDNVMMEPASTPLVGFGGGEVASLGTVNLPASLGEEPKRKTLMVKFLVVDMPFAYNVILGRPGLNSFRAVVSTYHLKMKFPTQSGIGEVVCDQIEAKRCYNLSLGKGEKTEKRKLHEAKKEEWQILKAGRLEPLGHKEVELIQGDPSKTTKIGPNLGQFEGVMIAFLRSNVDMFAWDPSNLRGINPEVIVHRLNVDPSMRSVQQKKRTFGGEKNTIIEGEVNKLLRAGYVSEVQYTDWLANVVLVPKLGGATYQRLVNKMFAQQIGKTMEVYVDDMLVKSHKPDEHLEHLKITFAIMREHGMKLNPNKCTFGVAGGKFLGYMVSERGIEANPEKIEAILNLKSPTSIKEELKSYLRSPPLLANPREGDILYLYLAISNNAVSSVLVKEKGKIQNPVYYVSKMLQGAETRYAEIEKLALAVVVTARKLRPYFQSHQIVKSGAPEDPGTWMLHVDGSSNAYNGGAGILIEGPGDIEIEVTVRLSFPTTNNEAEYEALVLGLEFAFEAGAQVLEVYTDSQVVAMQIEGMYETRKKSMTEYLRKTKERMQKFSKCTIQQIPRSENERADALSKLGATLVGIKDRKITVMIKERSAISGGTETNMVTLKCLWIEEITAYLKEGVLPTDPGHARRIKFKAPRFALVGTQLYKRTVEGPLLKCLDDPQARYVLQEVHEGSCGNHSGARSLAQKIARQGYFWPTLMRDCKEFVRRCEKCQKFASQIHTHAVPMTPVSITCPFDQWGIDILGPFPPARAQKKFVIVAVEYFSKWVEAEAVSKITEREAINFI
ncbi:UNVERIFIED_CONTAM: Retrovirus-related Pol polyprotein from transposon opus [Sesamum indicum]